MVLSVNIKSRFCFAIYLIQFYYKSVSAVISYITAAPFVWLSSQKVHPSTISLKASKHTLATLHFSFPLKDE